MLILRLVYWYKMKMTFITLPVDIIQSIQSYNGSNDAHSLCQTSDTCSRHGWLKSISLNGARSPSYRNFIRLCDRHRHTLKKIKVFGLRDPLLWLPNWYTTLEFIDCPGQSVLSLIRDTDISNGVDRKISLREIKRGNVVVNEKFIDVPKLSSLYFFM